MNLHSQARGPADIPWRRQPFMDVWVDDLTMSELCDHLVERGGLVLTLNPDHVYHLKHNQAFLEAYRSADFITADSVYLHWALRWLNTPVRERVCGSDLAPYFMRAHRNDAAVKVFLLGAAPGVAALAMARVNGELGREVVVGALGPSMRFVDDENEQANAVRLIQQSGANVLMVGLGAPKQEIWLARWRSQMPTVNVFMGVGATIDYMAGQVMRAPPGWRKLGAEWLYRVVTEPGRYFWRYLRNSRFFWWVWLARRERGARALR